MTLDADLGAWPGSPPCFAVQKPIPVKSYTIKIKFQNIRGWVGVDSGHIGLAFNMQNEKNFDFIYLR